MGNNEVQCLFCKRKIAKNKAFTELTPSGKKTRYFCNRDHRDLWANKNTYKPTLENEQRLYLTDYIQELYFNEGYGRDEINWTLLMSQVKNMMQEKGYKYTGIKLTLQYMIEIKEMNLFKDDSFNGSILNLVPFYYQEATNDWIKKREIKNMIENFDMDDDIKFVTVKNRKHKNKYTEIKIDEM